MVGWGAGWWWQLGLELLQLLQDEIVSSWLRSGVSGLDAPPPPLSRACSVAKRRAWCVKRCRPAGVTSWRLQGESASRKVAGASDAFTVARGISVWAVSAVWRRVFPMVLCD